MRRLMICLALTLMPFHALIGLAQTTNDQSAAYVQETPARQFPVHDDTKASTRYVAPSCQGLDAAVAGINPTNENYGGLLAEWRLAIVKETLENLFYWSTVILAGVAIFLTLYIAYLLKQRQHRVEMSADMMCQLYNQWAYASNRVRSTIQEHNDMVEKLDREFEVRHRSAASQLPVDLPTPPISAASGLASARQKADVQVHTILSGDLADPTTGAYSASSFPTKAFAQAYFTAKAVGQPLPEFDPVLHSDTAGSQMVANGEVPVVVPDGAATVALEKVHTVARAKLAEEPVPVGQEVAGEDETSETLRQKVKELELQLQASQDKATNLRTRLNAERERAARTGGNS